MEETDVFASFNDPIYYALKFLHGKEFNCIALLKSVAASCRAGRFGKINELHFNLLNANTSHNKNIYDMPMSYMYDKSPVLWS